MEGSHLWRGNLSIAVLIFRVNREVLFHLGWQNKRLVAQRTTVGFLASVNPHKMSPQVVRFGTGLLALRTAERFLPRVNFQMTSQCARLCKGFLTLRTLVGLLPGVNSEMKLKREGCGESLSALFTDERFSLHRFTFPCSEIIAGIILCSFYSIQI